GIDHFGKAVETGVRGSSAKEGRSDVVLALLGDKAISGEVTNTRLAVRKNRAGPGGRELPFTVRSVEMGTDDDGRAIPSRGIAWAGIATAHAPAEPSWPKSLGLLRFVLMELVPDLGTEQRPFPAGRLVRAIALELIRAEFCRRYPASADDARGKQAARRMAFN